MSMQGSMFDTYVGIRCSDDNGSDHQEHIGQRHVNLTVEKLRCVNLWRFQVSLASRELGISEVVEHRQKESKKATDKFDVGCV